MVNAEDVAFNDPPAGAAEQMILNRHLQRLLRHARLSAFQRFIQQARACCSFKPKAVPYQAFAVIHTAAVACWSSACCTVQRVRFLLEVCPSCSES